MIHLRVLNHFYWLIYKSDQAYYISDSFETVIQKNTASSMKNLSRCEDLFLLPNIHQIPPIQNLLKAKQEKRKVCPPPLKKFAIEISTANKI